MTDYQVINRTGYYETPITVPMDSKQAAEGIFELYKQIARENPGCYGEIILRTVTL